MKKIIAIIILICVLCLSILQVKEHASTDYNVLLITNESAVNGDDISDMISDIGKAYNITVTNLRNNNSLIETLADADEYTDIIIQDTYENLFNSNWELSGSLSTMNANNCYLGMPWKELTDAEKQMVKDKCQSIFGSSSLKVIERTNTNLLEVKEAGIEVANTTGYLTKAGELTLACTYITEITKTQMTGLTSYDGISDTSVKTIVDKVNSTMSIIEPLLDSTNENTTNTSNTTNTTNTLNKTTKTTAKTTKKTTTAMGSLKTDSIKFNYLRFKSDREPRLAFIKTDSDYLYIKFKDYDGIKCEHTGDTKNQPKVYTCDDATGKNKKEITDLSRCKKADYSNKQGIMYVYTLGIPSKYIGDKKTYFYVVGYDVHSHVIREYISVTRKKDGTYSLDRAPRSCAVTTDADKTKIGFLAIDYTGIATIKARTIKDKDVDVLGQWDGTTQKNWSQVESVTASKKNMTSAITSMNKVSTFFKNRTWKGKNPKVSGKDGVYKFVIEAKDAVGLSSVKTMSVNTTLIEHGYDYEPITTKKTTKKTSKKKETTKKISSSSSKEEGYWEIKNKKYTYHYKNGKTKEWTISEYIGWINLNNKDSKYNKNYKKSSGPVKALNPSSIKMTSKNRFTYNGTNYGYDVWDDTANNLAKRKGGSPYAITVDLDRTQESVFINNGTTKNPIWEPYKSSRCNVGGKWNNYATIDKKKYAKNSYTPTGLHYTNGNHSQDKTYFKKYSSDLPYWVGFDDGDAGRRPNNEDYLHHTMYNYLGRNVTGGCVTTFETFSKWIYYNIGRGTPVLIW